MKPLTYLWLRVATVNCLKSAFHHGDYTIISALANTIYIDKKASLYWTEPQVNSLRQSDAYMPPTEAISGSDNGLLPVQHQAIIWTNAVLLSIGPFLIQENAFENVICEMAAILPRPQCVNR